MALFPKRVKYRKSQRGRRKGVAMTGSTIAFGEFGLQCLENGWIKNTQIEAARVVISRHLKGGGKAWIRVFPDKPVSKKPAETRMGKGKGMTDHWVAVIKRGRILFEVEGLPEAIAKEAMRLASSKLPLKTKFVARHRAAV
ncbi:MAG: 50S ribosomal protein L16 [Candidatus Omnitrophota bacterium]